MNSEDIFIDTCAWVALADQDNTNHGNAIAVYPELLKSSRRLLTTNFVVAESKLQLL